MGGLSSSRKPISCVKKELWHIRMHCKCNTITIRAERNIRHNYLTELGSITDRVSQFCDRLPVFG